MSVTIKLGGKERVLRYPLRSCKRIDEVSGRDRSVIQGAIWDEDVSPSVLSLLLWGGLIHAEPELTIEQVEDMVEAHQMRAVHEAVCLAWIGLSDPNPPDEREDPPEDPPTAPA